MSEPAARSDLELDVQVASDEPDLPDEAALRRWVCAALGARPGPAALAIRIVDEAEGAALNERWRGRQGPTNVLSFPAEGLEAIAPEQLGDIVVCAPVVRREAAEQGKALEAHWAHLVIHGVLHLLGHEHDSDAGREAMEALEVRLLEGLGHPDPYRPRDGDG